MIKLSRLAIVSAISVSSLCLSANQAQAQQTRTFIDPSLGRLYIAGCLGSFRFSDSCSEAARRLIAEKFCQHQRYRTASQYQVRDLGWKNRHKMYAWREFYDDGELRTGFYEDVSSFRFTVIECRN